jgi:hypothetical protein
MIRITLGELRRFSQATKIDPTKLTDDIWGALRLAAWLHGKKTEKEFEEFLDQDADSLGLALKELQEALADFFGKIQAYVPAEQNGQLPKL